MQAAPQELKRRGMRLIVTPEQVEAIPAMKRWTKPTENYVEITKDDNLVLPNNESRKFLSGLGILGEIIHTPGHSDDSVSLVLDHGRCFHWRPYRGIDDCHRGRVVVAGSWQRLARSGVTTIYGGHGPVRKLATGTRI